MKVLSLFDGISCGMVALERAGIPVERYVAYEIDKYAIQVSKKNYPMIEHRGDVFDADFNEFKGFDLLIGGSPCTYWSIAKNNRETTPDGIGGQMFMQYVRALKESGCKWFLYENNFSIHKNIKAFISEQLGVEPIMINSALVSAQNRKRCYWTNIPGVEQPKDRGILLQDILIGGGYESSGEKLLHDSKLQRSSNLEQPRTQTKVDGVCPIPVKVGQQGKLVTQNTEGKSLCLLARDYKGFGNQEMNGVAEKYERNISNKHNE